MYCFDFSFQDKSSHRLHSCYSALTVNDVYVCPVSIPMCHLWFCEFDSCHESQDETEHCHKSMSKYLIFYYRNG